ncbi:hypothetical protein T4A_8698 [Trichinella pseudospiralis]|uniref:Uncharacterized protein n=1 Tax=Trichinella pseudospiralis TaxID=6337 RepID=A0A0V1DQD1_TRIPS|nr:hypothetical protein T4A_8698 [Trichinella pseudospiralis]
MFQIAENSVPFLDTDLTVDWEHATLIFELVTRCQITHTYVS